MILGMKKTTLKARLRETETNRNILLDQRNQARLKAISAELDAGIARDALANAERENDVLRADIIVKDGVSAAVVAQNDELRQRVESQTSNLRLLTSTGTLDLIAERDAAREALVSGLKEQSRLRGLLRDKDRQIMNLMDAAAIARSDEYLCLKDVHTACKHGESPKPAMSKVLLTNVHHSFGLTYFTVDVEMTDGTKKPIYVATASKDRKFSMAGRDTLTIRA
jgi:hypothetical protein